MSVELGNKSKTVKYLNIHKEGHTGLDYISVDNRWASPILEKQSDYLVAISRFEVPLNRVAVTAKMENCIEIFEYNDDFDDPDDEKSPIFHLAGGNYEDHPLASTDPEVVDNYFTACENYWNGDPDVQDANLNMTSGEHGYKIDMQPCHTIYEFVKKLNEQITEALLFNRGDKSIVPPEHQNGQSRSGSLEFPNMFTNVANNIVNTDSPIARFFIEMSADYTFSVVMNKEFALKYYIKMSKALFNMLQFKTIESDEYSRINLMGRRFMADRTQTYFDEADEIKNSFAIPNIRELYTKTKPPYARGFRSVQTTQQQTSLPQGQMLPINRHPKFDYGVETIEEYRTRFTAPTSAADSINRIKSIVFTSSLATLSEGVTGGGYRRALTDFVIPTQSTFSWNVKNLTADIVGENAASEYSYQNDNPSSGRLLIMSDPSPLYELKLEARVKVWDFEHERFFFEPIPLPAGSTFSCKIVFLSRNDPHERERPDAIVGH